MSEVNYRTRVRKGDFEVEVQGDKEFVLRKYPELAALVTNQAKATPELSSPPGQQSLAEFLREKNPTSHNDFGIVYAYYLHKSKGYDSYNVDDIDKCYTDSRTQKPKNLNAVMDSNVSRGFLMVADAKKDGKKAWVITRTGEEYVEAGLHRAS